MLEKDKREQRHNQEDAAFNKMLLWLLGAVVVELLLLLVKKLYMNFAGGPDVAMALLNFFHIFAFAGVALTAAAIVWTVLNYRKGKYVLVPCICAGAAAGLWLLSFMGYYLYDVGMKIMTLLPVVAAVLIVIYFLYQRVFFLNAMITAGGLMALWLHRQYNAMYSGLIRKLFAAGFVLLAAALVVVFLVRRGGGKLGGLQVMPPDTDYLMTWITCALTALAMALALALGVTVGFYMLFTLVAWVFIQAVFFTVRLM